MIVNEGDFRKDNQSDRKNFASPASLRTISSSTRGILRKIVLLLAVSSISIPACGHFLNKKVDRKERITSAVNKQIEQVIRMNGNTSDEAFDKKTLEDKIRVQTEEVLNKMEREVIACVDTFTTDECILLMKTLLQNNITGESIDTAVRQFRPKSQTHVETIAELLWECPALAPRILPTIHKHLEEKGNTIRFAIPSSHATLDDERSVLRIVEEFLGCRG